jgi:protein-tyrosine phosphatase
MANEGTPQSPAAAAVGSVPHRSALQALRAVAVRLGARWVAREARELPQRLLHPGRRRALREHVRRMGPPSNVLFVCQGNIYRSPYAALAFSAAIPAHLKGMVHVESGGFVGPNRPSPAAAIATAERKGVDLRAHRSSLLTPDRVRRADLIVVVEPAQRQAILARYPRVADRVVVLGDLDPEPIRTRTITDPWNQDETVLQQSYDRVERCVRELARACF